jgi:CRP/FNR family cyclic AMP-dependent transcriptional regulator
LPRHVVRSGMRRKLAEPRKKVVAPLRKLPPGVFDLRAFLDRHEVPRRIVTYAAGDGIYAQGDAANTVLYIQEGGVKFAVVSPRGKEAIIGLLGQGDFFGEGCLAGQPRRMASASAMTPTTVLVVRKPQMVELLRTQPALVTRLLSHMLARTIRVEEALVDQLFNSSEKRLARVLLLLAHYGKNDRLVELPTISQETLAEMVGTTRSRINFFMTKFRRLGFIDYNGHIRVNNSLITILLND